jgi:methyltransferase
MGLSVTAYMGLLLSVGCYRLVEVRISSQHQRELAARGIAKAPEKCFAFMVLLHIGILASAALEVLLVHRPFIAILALSMGLLFVLANLLRWWVILTLSGHWNIQVMASTAIGVVTRGPYRWIRHPNYVAVVVELLALPLIHSAWFTAVWGGVAHIWVLRRRISVEEQVLLNDPVYRRVMAFKPRFIPRLISKPSSSTSPAKTEPD